MRMRIGPGRLLLTAGAALTLACALLVPAAGHAAAGESLAVDLSSTRGPSTGVGEGFLYGFTEDGTQPADQFIQPLGINAFRGGGWFSGGWIRDGYQNGTATQADLNSIIEEARRLTQPPYHAQYQVLVTDIYGLNGGQPSNTMYPCDNGNCSNWISFIDATVGALQATGLKFAYDIDNEPDISVFWTRGVNSTQYFQMWDTAFREIRRIGPGAQIVGPSFGFTPQRSPGEWQTWLAHVKAAGTVPDMISNHNEGDVDDPVTVAQTLNSDLAAAGIGGAGELQAQNSGQDVAVANNSTAQGTPDIVQEPANGAAGSLWQPLRQSDGSYEFRNQNSGLCLDVNGAGSNLGQQLDQWPCKNASGTNQDFMLG